MKKLLGILSMLLALVVFPMKVNGQSQGAGFAIAPVFPENQIGNATYFDLLVQPGQKQDLEMKVVNLEDDTKKIKISPNAAFTNKNGVIEYSNYEIEKDDTAKYTIKEVISEPQEVELQPKEEKNVTFQLSVPEGPFEGQILGGFQAKQVVKEEETESSEDTAFNIKNEYALVLGISLREQEEITIKPELKLKNIKPVLEAGDATIAANIQNTQPVAFGNMKVDAKIYRDGENQVYQERVAENQTMAPNSNYDFMIPIKDETLQAGDYRMKVVAEAGDQKWEMEDTFTVKADEARKINEQTEVGQKEKKNMWLIALCGLGGLILLISVYLLGKKRAKK